MKLFVLSFLLATSLAAQPVEIKWSESPAVFAGKRVELRLKDGSSFEGRWIDVTPDTVRFVHSNTVVTYPKSSISQARLGHWRIRGRVLGSVLAFYVLGSVAANKGNGTGYAILPGMGAGFALGYAWDKKTKPVAFRPK